MSLSPYHYPTGTLSELTELCESLAKRNRLSKSDRRECYWAEKKLDVFLHEIYEQRVKEGKEPFEIQARVYLGYSIEGDADDRYFGWLLGLQKKLQALLTEEPIKTGRPSLNGLGKDQVVGLAVLLKSSQLSLSYTATWNRFCSGRAPKRPSCTPLSAAIQLHSMLTGTAESLGVKEGARKTIVANVRLALSDMQLTAEEVKQLSRPQV